MNDAQRYPLLTDVGQRILLRLREHPHAPRWNHPGGERLDAPALARVRTYAKELTARRTGWKPGELPGWLLRFVGFCRRDVPFHRRRADWSDDFFALPPTTRADLRRQPWAFVPDSADLTDLVVYTTSGTTGDRLYLPATPEAPNRYLPLFQTALARHGVTLEGGPRVSIVQICAQLHTVTNVSVMSYLDSAGFAKVNLNPAEWNAPDDRVRFLDDLAAEVYTGDPFAFAELAALATRHRPKALISVATALHPGLRCELAARFDCPVIDVYSLTESGPVSFAVADGRHEVLPHDLYVEILNPDGQPCPPGERGEIVLTGGVNPLLPLLRYRTGDFAALDFSELVPALIGFEGRRPVRFRDRGGRWLNSVDVSATLRDVALPFLALHQSADGALTLQTRCDPATANAAAQALRGLFGDDQPLTVEQVPTDEAWAGKVIQYTSDLDQTRF